MPLVIILTALPVEYMAVRSHLTNLKEEIHPQGSIYERGIFLDCDQEWEIGIADLGAGNASSAVEAERVIAYFKPNIIFLVGIAGGIKDVAVGDVVAATKVYGYESGKAEAKSFSTRPTANQSTYSIVQRAKMEARKKEWLQRIIGDSDSQPCAFVAPIAAGEKIISSKDTAVFQFLRHYYNDAIAVEMEGVGFLKAVHANQKVSAIVIRGISFLLDESFPTTDPDKRKNQERAARHASAFCFELLVKLSNIQNEKKNTNKPISIPPQRLSAVEKSDNADIDLSNLRKLLFKKKYKEADQETVHLILHMADKSVQDGLSVQDILGLESHNLRSLSLLWREYSDNKFGFEKQIEIWQILGGRMDNETELALGCHLGWRRDHSWRSYSEIKFSKENTLEGHFPAFFLSPFCWRGDLLLLEILHKVSKSLI